MSEFPDWFNMLAVKNFDAVLKKEFRDRTGLNFLQIGAYTGDASEWLMRNVLDQDNGVLVDVDTWGGSDEPWHKSMSFNEVEKRYDERMREFNNVVKCKSTSAEYLMKAPRDYFDFIYVDGDHTAEAVILDALLAWRCLKQGGIIAFDDYLWNNPEKPGSAYTPRPAVDFFINNVMIDGRGEKLVVPEEWQIWIRRR